MAVRTKEEILEILKGKFGEDDSDEAIALLEDVSDTYDDMAGQISQSGEWKQKYEQNDKEWREKYRDRFFSKDDNGVEELATGFEEEKEDEKPMTFDDLFEEGVK